MWEFRNQEKIGANLADIDDLRDYISLIAGDITSEELTSVEFELLVKKALSIYNSYCPDERETIAVITGSLLNSTGGYQFPQPYPQVASATPQYAGLNWWPEIASASYTYNNKNGLLMIPLSGTYIIKYSQEITLDTANERDHPLFFKLLEALFKIVVGGRRKKFALLDFQISNDGDSLVQEGTTMLEETKLDLLDNVPFWLALNTR